MNLQTKIYKILLDNADHEFYYDDPVFQKFNSPLLVYTGLDQLSREKPIKKIVNYEGGILEKKSSILHHTKFVLPLEALDESEFLEYTDSNIPLSVIIENMWSLEPHIISMINEVGNTCYIWDRQNCYNYGIFGNGATGFTYSYECMEFYKKHDKAVLDFILYHCDSIDTFLIYIKDICYDYKWIYNQFVANNDNDEINIKTVIKALNNKAKKSEQKLNDLYSFVNTALWQALQYIFDCEFDIYCDMENTIKLVREYNEQKHHNS